MHTWSSDVISEKDVKALKGISEKQFKLVQAAFFLAIIFQLFIAFHNLSLAIEYGQEIGLDAKGILAMWNAEPNLQKNYIGYEVQSNYRLNMAILSFGLALLFVIFAVSMSIDRNRNKRVLSALKQCGAINGGTNA